MLKIYADESGTHHPFGEQPNSEVPVLAGYMAKSEDWERFCREWAEVLKRYDVNCFHAKVFEARADYPYFKWDIRKYESFRYALAEIAGRNIPLGGSFHIKEHHRLEPGDISYLPAKVIFQFFTDMIDALNEFGFQQEKVALFFDNGTGKKWNRVIDEGIEKCKESGVKIIGHIFGNDEEMLPLQAADMISHRARKLHFDKLQKQVEIKQKTGRDVDIKIDSTVLDIMLNRNLRPVIGFRPVITESLQKEIDHLVPNYAPVRRALTEIPNDPFKLKNRKSRYK